MGVFRTSWTVLLICSLSDLRDVGPMHTWWNSSDTKPLFKKLDKVLVNCDWLLKFHDLSYFYSSGSL